MSSIYVRTQIKTFLSINAATETVVDLSGQYEEMQDLLNNEGLIPDDKWVGIQFMGSDEVPVSIMANNAVGKYRETGVIHIHTIDIAKLGVADAILTRAEALRDLFRGQRIGNILIESVTPVNFDAGAALKFEAGFMCGSFMMSYRYDRDL